MQACLGSGKRTPHPLLGIARQNDRAMQERGCRGQAAARLRAAGGLLERRGDRLVGPRCGCGQMPRATVGVDAAVGRLCQGQMDLPALLSGRCSVYGGAHQRMTEGHALARAPAARPSPRPPPRPRCRVARKQRSSSSGSPTGSAAATQQQTPRVVGERAQHDERSSPRSALRALLRLGRPKPPASCLAVKPRGQLEQRQRIPARLGDDPVADSLIQLDPQRRAQQRAGIIRRASRLPPARAGAASSSPGSRAANTIPTRSASRRRATKASVSAEARSSHCASSTTHSSGRSLGRLPRTDSTPPTRRGTGPERSPALRPNTISRA